MKLSFKTILPILLIFTLLILFAGCFITPSDEQPGYTPGTITGIIAAPCCSTSADPVPDPCCIAPEYWCYYCENTWSLQDNIKVVLTYGEDEIATVFTNEDGEYTFTNVAPGKNYVITALCPDYDDDRPLVKDVALELIEGGSFDTKITDCVSTALGLVVDYLVENTTVLGPEEIVLDGVIAGIPNFYGFPEFKKLVLRICEIAPGCVNLFDDEKVPDYLCRAAQEIGRKVIPDLDLGCTPGFTPGPGPGPTPDPCEGHTAPYNILLDPLVATAGQPYSGTVSADDNDEDTRTFTLTVGPEGMTLDPVTGEITWTPGCEDSCGCPGVDQKLAQVAEIKLCDPIEVTVSDDCHSVDVLFCIEVSPNSPPSFTNLPNDPAEEAKCGDSNSFQVVATDTDSSVLTYTKEGTWPTWLDMNGDGLISWAIPCPFDTPDSYSVNVKVSDECSDVIETFTIKVTCEPVVGLEDDFRVAFEDIPWGPWIECCHGTNDFDYNDCVSDVNVVGEFICGNLLKEITFEVTYVHDGSGYLDHEFGLAMPSIFVGKTCTYDLNSLVTSDTPCPEEFIFFDKDTADPVADFYLTITFDEPFAYSYTGFTASDIHGDSMDVKPFIDILNGSSERLLAGTGDKRVLLVPDGWQWPSPDSTPLWDVYAEVIENNCYPEFTNPGTWTLTP